MLLKGKNAVVAGDAFGIGRATALLFAREGANVFCIDDNAGLEAANNIRIADLEFPYCHADLTLASQVQSAVNACAKVFQRVDILFNVAGRVLKQSFEAT